MRWSLLQRKPLLGSALREGVAVQLCTATGTWGRGEAWPLPGWSVESVQDVCGSLAALPRQALIEEWEVLAETPSLPPSLRWALSVASLGNPSPSKPFTRRTAVLLSGPLETIRRRLNELATIRYPVAKIKLGAFELEDAVECVQDVIMAWPWALLRLDANLQWTEKQLIQLIESIPLGKVDFIEDPNVDLSAWMAQRPQVSIGIDQTLRRALETQSSIPPAQVWVLKPTLLGSYSYVRSLQARARKLGARVVFSSCFEGASTITLQAMMSESDEIHGWDPYWWHEPDGALSVIPNGLIHF